MHRKAETRDSRRYATRYADCLGRALTVRSLSASMDCRIQASEAWGPSGHSFHGAVRRRHGEKATAALWVHSIPLHQVVVVVVVVVVALYSVRLHLCIFAAEDLPSMRCIQACGGEFDSSVQRGICCGIHGVRRDLRNSRASTLHYLTHCGLQSPCQPHTLGGGEQHTHQV
ncbi:hypothetical protein VTK56DRAFT_4573 [Thermocarpiscus australiensis]